jgi:eukaryotic-like serine/threonine-protein kinase
LLLTGQNDRIPFSWSPDGRFLMYSESSAKRLTYLQVPSDGTPSSGPIPFLENSFRNSQAQFSPDGKWVAYTSDASSRPEIYVRPFPPPKGGGSQWMISNGGGTQPRWNRNGKELFYLSGRKMMSVDVTTGTEFHAGIPKVLFDSRIYASVTLFDEPDWDVTPDGQRFLITSEPLEHNATPINVVLNWLEGLHP